MSEFDTNPIKVLGQWIPVTKSLRGDTFLDIDGAIRKQITMTPEEREEAARLRDERQREQREESLRAFIAAGPMTAEEIVNALGDDDPPIDDEGDCERCGTYLAMNIEDSVPADHTPTCLWRHALAWRTGTAR